MKEEQVILVDEFGQETGVMEKTEAHRKGLLHSAFSIFIINSKGEMLLQQRALHKYHSGGLWTNACCSHPRPGESLMEAAGRRLQEEMGFNTRMEKLFDFIYKAEVDNGLTEHEFDHVLTGEYNGMLEIKREEVADYCFKSVADIEESLMLFPEKYTVWFRIAFPRVKEWITEKNKTKISF